ncbi:helix-turn-helix transcriptional regulator [Clostridium gasigenes]|uniref:Helix-turn-helix domain-containing protein n=1 Tax=Clostridium gasigenes TaxID=94869 RepID=A0A7X0VU02_9CLOT|nr:helix-turn-helix domain-containing protein [Clostridium gasigenes]MBB6715966.1 helix-turn-helix domain-containing protein [Clostridium gasigenes]
MSIENKLKEIRMRDYLMDPEDFAKLIDVNIKSYYSYEKGSSRPTLEKALEIAKKLNKNIEEIWYLD